jgi:S-adenosylmethionine hydrolase
VGALAAQRGLISDTMPPIVTLLTDFGTADGYVAELKGVLLTQAPGVTLVDAAHDVPAHDVESGRLALARYWRRFPRGTCTWRWSTRGWAAGARRWRSRATGVSWSGPDNGVLSPALLAAGARAVALPVPPRAAPTFHGRDVFAPAAARLALGEPLDSLGAPADEPWCAAPPRRGACPTAASRGA